MRSDSIGERPGGGGIDCERNGNDGATGMELEAFSLKWLLPAMSWEIRLKRCNFCFLFFFRLRLGSFGSEGGGPGITKGGIVGSSSLYNNRTDLAIADTVGGRSGWGGLAGALTACRSQ